MDRLLDNVVGKVPELAMQEDTSCGWCLEEFQDHFYATHLGCFCTRYCALRAAQDEDDRRAEEADAWALSQSPEVAVREETLRCPR